MRESFDLLRGLQRGAFGEAQDAAEARRSWALYFAVAAVAGAFLALVGAFGTVEAPIAVRFAYWIPTMMIGAALGYVAAAVVRRWLCDTPAWVQTVATAFVMTALTAAAIWAVTAAVFDVHPALLPMFGMVLVVSLAMSALFGLLAQARTLQTHAGPSPPRFLDRFPAKLRGAALYAVEAEDHYLRLHTSKGQDLLLMRLGDAIAELEGLEGAQTHRSWWVARDGVVGVKRADGKVWLQLHDGADAPVSRGNVKALREAGWL